MKKIYQRPETELVATLVQNIMGISGEVDGKPEIPYGGDDPGVPAETNKTSLWDEEE